MDELISKFIEYVNITADFENHDPSPQIRGQLKQSYQELQDCIKNYVDTEALALDRYIQDLNTEIAETQEAIKSNQCHCPDASNDQLWRHLNFLKIILRSSKELSFQNSSNNDSSLSTSKNTVTVDQQSHTIQEENTICIGEESNHQL